MVNGWKRVEMHGKRVETHDGERVEQRKVRYLPCDWLNFFVIIY